MEYGFEYSNRWYVSIQDFLLLLLLISTLKQIDDGFFFRAHKTQHTLPRTVSGKWLVQRALIFLTKTKVF